MTGAPLAVAAITFDFGNTLVHVDRSRSRQINAATAAAMAAAGLIRDEPGFLAAWAEERDRQFREEVPQLREVDVAQRAVRVLARTRGMASPASAERWDDAAAARLVDRSEVGLVVDAYAAAFIDVMDPVPDARATLERLAARGFGLAILSNWPLAEVIDRFAEAQGWLPLLHAIVVSQRVGTIKPHPAIFGAAESALGLAGAGERILHVGDDWAADVVGARAAGWHAAYLRGRQADTPLPTSEPGDGVLDGTSVQADLEIDDLGELEGHVILAAGPEPATPARTA